MARNGAGTYQRIAGTPYVYDTVIDETVVNSEFDDIATALTQSLAKDGQTVPTANIPMGGYKLTGLGNATVATDALALGQMTADGGSALVGFLQSGTGATERTVQSKLREFVSVKDFGAVGDGSTNNFNALQAAIKAVGDSGGKTLYIPAGTYVVELVNGINLVDTAGNAIHGIEIFGDGDASVLKIGLTSSKNYQAMLGSVQTINDVYIHDLAFDFNTARAATRVGTERFHNPAIMLTQGGVNIRLQNLSFLNASVDQPIRMANLTAPLKKVDGVIIDSCRFYGFSDGVTGNDQVDISCIYAYFNNMRITNCDFYSGLTDMSGVSSKGITAIECYGKQAVIDGNHFRYVNRAHIVGSVNVANETDNILITNNTYTNCVCFVDSSTRSEAMGSITFSGNQTYTDSACPLHLPQFLDLNFSGGGQPDAFNHLCIKGNNFVFASGATAATSTSYSHLVESSTTKLVEFTGNTVEGHPSGIFHTEFFDTGIATMSLVFKGNIFRNIRTDTAKDGRGSAAFFVEASGVTLGNLVFSDNYVENWMPVADRSGTSYAGPLVAVIYNGTGNARIVQGNNVLGGDNLPYDTNASTWTISLKNTNKSLNHAEGTWTPVDASGAGLSFTGAAGKYLKLGNCVQFTCTVTYPATADPTQAKIGGLPYSGGTAGTNGAGVVRYTDLNLSLTCPVYNSEVQLFKLDGNDYKNVNVSGKTFHISGFYFTS